MSEEMKKRMGELVLSSSTDLVNWIKGTKAFVAGQVPEVLSQWLKMMMVEHLMWALASGLLAGASLVIAYRVGVWCAKMFKDGNADAAIAIPALFLILPIGFGGSAFFSHTLSALQIWITPKAFLLKTFVEMVRG